MTNGLDLELVSSGSLVKKGYTAILSNVGKTVAAITLAVSALVSFTEISFSGVGSASFSSTLVMMLIASYVMYFSLEDAGERLGREDSEYKAVSDRYRELQQKITGDDVGELRAFCLEYKNAELKYRRDDLLFSLGYTRNEYESYLKGAQMPKKARKALYRVKKLKCANLDAAMLLSKNSSCGCELKSPERLRLFGMILKLVPSTVCMLFTVSVMISVRDNMTVAGMLEALVKLSTLPIIGLKGYSGGYEYVTKSEKEWLKTKSRLIETFLKDRK